MMKILLTVFGTIFILSLSKAQNLVLNPSLESYITCPGFGQFSNSYIDNWDKPTYGSTDYYHYSCPGIIPSQQIPRSGDAYAGIIGYNYGQEYREYMTGMLTAPLIPGATYYCEFYVSLNDGYIQAIKELGAYFSINAPGPYLNALHVPVTPQIENTTTLLDDTSAWMRVSGYFLAAGGEQYITIGNFNDDTSTTIVQVGNVGSYGSYYFVDDVWVSIAEGTSVSENANFEIQIFPNPVQDKIKIIGNNKLSSLIVFNPLGEEVLKVSDPRSPEIDVTFLNAGIYFLQGSDGKNVSGKMFVKH